MITTDAGQSQGADSVRDTIAGRGWVAGGLAVDGDMAALGETMRPIDALTSAGLGALIQYVQPLQDVLDRLTGNASVIQSFADTWQRVGLSVDQVGQQLGDQAPAHTAEWHGDAAELYRGRATELTGALHETATLSIVISTLAGTMGQVVAGARGNTNELLTDLVQRLISYVKQASAAEGGLTPNVMAQATTLINAYQEPILAVEDKLRQTIDNVETILTSGGGSQPVRLAMMRRNPDGRNNTGDFPILEGGGGRGFGGPTTSSGPNLFDRLRGLFQRRGPNQIQVPQTKPQQQPSQQQQQWPKKEDYDKAHEFGRDKHNALANIQRPFEGTQLKNGWEVSKVERTAGGTKRVDVMYVNHAEKRVLVEDYVTGKLESVEHANKGWRYMHEPEIQNLRNQGYKFDYVPSFTEKLH